MHRRKFITVGASLFSVVLASGPLRASSNPQQRVGMSTVTFRHRFAQTKPKEVNKIKQELTLVDTPEYFADRFGIHNVEYWSRHFESLEPAYLDSLKKKIKKTKSRLTNIQLDQPYQLGAPDETKRKESLELVLQWVEAAHQVGAHAIRVNPGKGEVTHSIQALKTINEAAKKHGLILMTENHFGMEMDPEVHLRIVKEVGDNMYTLPDYGNYDDAVRYDALRRVMPYAYQISAKAADFNKDLEHTAYDFGRCMQIAKESGFQGIYSVEQWSRIPLPDNISAEQVTDWLIDQVKAYVS